MEGAYVLELANDFREGAPQVSLWSLTKAFKAFG